LLVGYHAECPTGARCVSCGARVGQQQETCGAAGAVWNQDRSRRGAIGDPRPPPLPRHARHIRGLLPRQVGHEPFLCAQGDWSRGNGGCVAHGQQIRNHLRAPSPGTRASASAW